MKRSRPKWLDSFRVDYFSILPLSSYNDKPFQKQLLTLPCPVENCPLPSLERIPREDLFLWMAVKRKIKNIQLCNAFEWNTMEYPRSQLYFLCIHTSLLTILDHAKEKTLTVEYTTISLYSDWLYFLWHGIKIYSPRL